MGFKVDIFFASPSFRLTSRGVASEAVPLRVGIAHHIGHLPLILGVKLKVNECPLKMDQFKRTFHLPTMERC